MPESLPDFFLESSWASLLLDSVLAAFFKASSSSSFFFCRSSFLFESNHPAVIREFFQRHGLVEPSNSSTCLFKYSAFLLAFSSSLLGAIASVRLILSSLSSQKTSELAGSREVKPYALLINDGD